MEKDFIDLVNKRQACRDFNGEKVKTELLEKIIETARLSPSACNSQPWKMICVTNEEKKKDVLDALQEGGRNLFLTKATAFIAIVEKNAVLKLSVNSRLNNNHFVKYDVGELIAYLTLTARYYGVESCIIGWVNPEKIKETLCLSKDENCNIVIALGYSDGEVREKKRKSVEEVSTFIK